MADYLSCTWLTVSLINDWLVVTHMANSLFPIWLTACLPHGWPLVFHMGECLRSRWLTDCPKINLACTCASKCNFPDTRVIHDWKRSLLHYLFTYNGVGRDDCYAWVTAGLSERTLTGYVIRRVAVFVKSHGNSWSKKHLLLAFCHRQWHKYWCFEAIFKHVSGFTYFRRQICDMH